MKKKQYKVIKKDLTNNDAFECLYEFEDREEINNPIRDKERETIVMLDEMLVEEYNLCILELRRMDYIIENEIITTNFEQKRKLKEETLKYFDEVIDRQKNILSEKKKDGERHEYIIRKRSY